MLAPPFNFLYVAIQLSGSSYTLSRLKHRMSYVCSAPPAPWSDLLAVKPLFQPSHGGKGSVLDLGVVNVNAIKMVVHRAVVCVVSSSRHLAYLKKLVRFGKSICFAPVH